MRFHEICVHCEFEWQWHVRDDGVSNRQPHDCLLKRLFRRKSKKTSKLRITGLCVGNSPVTGEFPAQRASNTENVSIWWCHHENHSFLWLTFHICYQDLVPVSLICFHCKSYRMEIKVMSTSYCSLPDSCAAVVCVTVHGEWMGKIEILQNVIFFRFLVKNHLWNKPLWWHRK